MKIINPGALVALQYGINRSPKWEEVREAHLRIEPQCVACKACTSDKKEMQVHHIFPFQYCIALGRPDLELDERNLITLRESEEGEPIPSHHLLIGHPGDFESDNLNVVRDAKKTYHGMNAAQIKSDPIWLAEKLRRLEPLDKMTEAEKQQLRAEMDTVFPLG